jgi:hypothetical protein
MKYLIVIPCKIQAMEIADCRWPALATSHGEALRHAVAFVAAEFRPVAIVAAGSIVRGVGDARSDIDLFVIHAEPFKQRLQRRFAGVPVEIFVNPPGSVREYFAGEHARARPSTAHMLATGFVVLDAPLLEVLRAEAADWLKKRSPLSADQDIWARYIAASKLEDAEDVQVRDPAMATALLYEAVTEALRYWIRVRRGVLPGAKRLIEEVRADDAALGMAAERFFRASSIDERVMLARQIAQRCIGAVGFFEWDSPKIPVPFTGDRIAPSAAPLGVPRPDTH